MHRLMRAPARVLALGASLSLAVTGVAAAHPGHSHAHDLSAVVGHVFVNDNTANANTIAAYDRHADGTLTPVPGSPFATGGAGSGAVIGSQGAVQFSATGRWLVAVDAGSNQISVLRVKQNGALRQVPGGTVSSGGTEPVSVAVNGHRVYVANAGVGGSDYTGFTLHRHGQLSPLPGSTIPLPDSAAPGDVLINPTGTELVGTRVGTSQIDAFAIDQRGGLHAAPGSPYAAQGPGPFGSEFSPTAPGQLFVSNAHGGTNAGTVSAFTVGQGGSLSALSGSPFADDQTAPCWVEISHDGRLLFAVNTAVPSISRYRIASDGTLTLLGSTPFSDAGAAGFAPQDARLSPDGSTLWVVDSKAAAISGFAVHGGHLAELAAAQTTLPTGSTPFGVAVN
jgi:6-phosphogluconolactonase